MWSVWNFKISRIDQKNSENIVAVMQNLWVSSKNVTFFPSKFSFFIQVFGHKIQTLHVNSTHIRRQLEKNFLIETSILDHNWCTKVGAQVKFSTFFSFQKRFSSKFSTEFHTKKHFLRRPWQQPFTHIRRKLEKNF